MQCFVVMLGDVKVTAIDISLDLFPPLGILATQSSISDLPFYVSVSELPFAESGDGLAFIK